LKHLLKIIPFLKALVSRIKRKLFAKPFPGTEQYWIDRYASGGNSGKGSYDQLAEFKAQIINSFVKQKNIQTVIEFGCGDGNQLTYAEYPRYLGLDVSPVAIDICKKIFEKDSNKTFKLIKDYEGEKSDLSLSLDVIYHLVEDEIYESYMKTLFDASEKYVIIYSSNMNEWCKERCTHVRHRIFTYWVETRARQWKLLKHVSNPYPYSTETGEGSLADFYLYVLS